MKRFFSPRSIKMLAAAGLFATALFVLTCGGAPESPKFYRTLFSRGMGEGEVVAEVGDFQLTSEHFLALYNNLPENARRAMTPEKFLENYVNQKMLYFDAVENGMHLHPELRARLELAWNDIFSVHYYSIRQKMEVAEDAMRRYYEEHRETFVRPERVRVCHIVATPAAESTLANTLKDDAVGDEAARKKMERLNERLKSGEKFETLARQYSEDGSAAQGGDVGFLRRGQTDVDFEKAAFALQALGEQSGVVKTKFGYHILELLDREEGGYLTYVEAKPQIIAALEPPQNPAERDRYMEDTLAALKQRYHAQIYKDRIPPP